jgi:hypothetical protein
LSEAKEHRVTPERIFARGPLQLFKASKKITR